MKIYWAFCTQSYFSTLFPEVRPFANWAPSPLSLHNSPPPSKFDSPIHELILVMSGQCTDPVLPTLDQSASAHTSKTKIYTNVLIVENCP